MTRNTINRMSGWRALAIGASAALALLGAAAPASAATTAEPTGTVTGLLLTTAGTPAVDALVGIEYYNDGEAYTLTRTRTDSTGRYTFTGVFTVSPADVVPTLELFASEPYVTQVLVPALTVEADVTTTVPTATVTKGATVTGRVLSATTGEPIRGAQIEDSGFGSSFTTGSNGRFTIRTHTLGDVEIAAYKRSGYHSASTTVTVGEDGTANVGSLLLEPTKGHVRGHLETASGHPLANATVTLVGTGQASQGETESTTTTKTGRFSVRAKIGAYALRISAPGRVTKSRHVHVSPDGVLHLGGIVLAARHSAR